jgi:hypothetical protein
LIICTSVHYSQQIKLTGKVLSRTTGELLQFANVRVENSNLGTAANIEGEFELNLDEGNYNVIASYIGYRSDTINVSLRNNLSVVFLLSREAIQLSQVTVTPGENPAMAIIRKAIETKNNRNELLNQFTYSAYTKGVIKTTSDISAAGLNVTLDLALVDTADLKITGILENESRGYFRKPDDYKEEIIARKQSSNFPSTLNMLTGGRIIQNFYSDDIQFFNRPLLSPIADNSLDYYYYHIEDEVVFEDKRVYQIFFAANNNSNPGFFGRIFIADSTYDLVKVDIGLNDAANPGGLFKEVRVIQQFMEVENVAMPVDYRLFVEGNLLGMVKFGIEINSILYNYEINKEMDSDVFDMAFLTVLPEADNKESFYWDGVQSIPNTDAEMEAYQRIDSVEAIPLSFSDRFSWFSVETRLTDNFSISGPLSIYHFNRVEGHTLKFNLELQEAYNKRLNSNVEVAYGFSDKRFKVDLNFLYSLGKYRTHRIKVDAHNKLNILFEESDRYNLLTSTLTNLFLKYDFRNYYYSKGASIVFNSEVFPTLDLGVGFLTRYDKSATTNTDFSFFSSDKTYDPNPPVYENRLNALTVNFSFDFRKYIEDGYFRRRVPTGKSYVLIFGDALFSNDDVGSNLTYSMYKLNFWTEFNSFKSTKFNIGGKAIFSYGAVPYQMMYALPGNVTALGKDFSFRTLKFGEIFGDKAFAAGLKYSFNDELFKMFNIPLLKDSEIIFSTHFNVAWIIMADDSKELNKELFTYEVVEFEKPFLELGFAFGHTLIPLSVEFTWKLTHQTGNNFVVGVNTLIF